MIKNFFILILAPVLIGCARESSVDLKCAETYSSISESLGIDTTGHENVLTFSLESFQDRTDEDGCKVSNQVTDTKITQTEECGDSAKIQKSVNRITGLAKSTQMRRISSQDPWSKFVVEYECEKAVQKF